VSIEDMDAGQNALLVEVMALSPEVRRVKLLSAAKAALMLDMSVSTLEKRRKQSNPRYASTPSGVANASNDVRAEIRGLCSSK
jgi:hypothetical protein